MTPVRRIPRRLAPVLVLALLLVMLPLEPVVAQASAPDTKAVVLDDFEVDDRGSAQAAADPGGDKRSSDDADQADQVAPEELSNAEVAAPDTAEAQRSEVKEAPFPFSGLGFRGDGTPPTLSYRVLEPSGTWTAWTSVEYVDEFDGPDEGSEEAAAADAPDWVSEPIWVGEATHLQLDVVGASLDDVGATVIDTMGLSETLFRRMSRHVGSLGTPTAEASVARPDIVTRKGWNANEDWRSGSPSYRTPRAAVVHHTATSNTYTREQAAGQVRNMYHWHTVGGNGWSDLGYNFVVDRFGTIYEGRYGGVEAGVIGAHAGGWNTGTFGVAVMGHHNNAEVSSAAFASVTNLIAWKFDVHGIDPDPAARASLNGHQIRTIEGHRNVRATYIAESNASSFQTDCPGRLFYPRMGELRNDVYVRAGDWTPVVGDWNGDGRTTPGWFKDGTWRLRNANSAGNTNIEFRYGLQPGDLPVVGDWNGDGRTTVGIVREGRWHLRNANTAGFADISFNYGRGAIDYPMAGDWNRDGRDTPAIVRDGEWHLRNSLSGGPGQIVFTYGRITRGDIPVVGDWNGNGIDTPGILRNGEWHLRNTHAGGASDVFFVYGRLTRGDTPIVGDWNRDGRTTIGVTRDGTWHLRNFLSGGPASHSFSYQ